MIQIDAETQGLLDRAWSDPPRDFVVCCLNGRCRTIERVSASQPPRACSRCGTIVYIAPEQEED